MAMEIDLGPQAERFRDELRQWLEANRPEGLDDEDERIDDEMAAFGGARHRVDRRSCIDAGYLCVAWPKEFGGRGLTGIEVAVMNEEFARAKVVRVSRGMGEWLVGPSIIV